MADHLYTGPVNKQLRGNREDARRLEREARAKVGYLFDAMRPGETFKTGSWSLGDGRRIIAFVWNDVLGKRATVRLTGIGKGKEGVIVEYYMDHGLSYYDSGTEQVLFALDTELKDHFVNDAGILLFIGNIRVNSISCIDVAGTLPDISEDNLYLSFAWEGTPGPVGSASQFSSGLGSLFRQGLIGAGKDHSAYTGKYKTLIRSPQGAYWIVETDLVGDAIILSRMSIPEHLICIESAITDGVLTGRIGECAQAFVLGNIQPTSDEEITLSDVGFPAIDPDFDIAPWPWQWSYQGRGESDEFSPKACRTIITEITPSEPTVDKNAKTYELSFTWDVETGEPNGVQFNLLHDEDFLFTSDQYISAAYGFYPDSMPFSKISGTTIEGDCGLTSGEVSLSVSSVNGIASTCSAYLATWYNRVAGIEGVKYEIAASNSQTGGYIGYDNSWSATHTSCLCKIIIGETELSFGGATATVSSTPSGGCTGTVVETQVSSYPTNHLIHVIFGSFPRNVWVLRGGSFSTETRSVTNEYYCCQDPASDVDEYGCLNRRALDYVPCSITYDGNAAGAWSMQWFVENQLATEDTVDLDIISDSYNENFCPNSYAYQYSKAPQWWGLQQDGYFWTCNKPWANTAWSGKSYGRLAPGYPLVFPAGMADLSEELEESNAHWAGAA